MIKLLHGDALERLKSLPSNSAHALVTDPPSATGFMNLEWDKSSSREQWVEWLSSILREARRVLTPGAHALVWALPRTSHWTALAIEEAGFEIRDSIHHIFGTGFPKSLDISKAIDKELGAKRRVVGSKLGRPGMSRDGSNQSYSGSINTYGSGEILSSDITSPSSHMALKYEGFHTALKPAHEVWWLARVPLKERTVALNVMEWSTGGMNIDKSRVPTQESAGRFPPNVLFSHSQECSPCADDCAVKELGEQSGVSESMGGDIEGLGFVKGGSFGGVYGGGGVRTVTTSTPKDKGDASRFFPVFKCAEECAVKELGEQSGVSESMGGEIDSGDFGKAGTYYKARGAVTYAFGDKGDASRFFPVFKYSAKPSRAEREAGCEGLNGKSGFEAVGRGEGSRGLESPRSGAGRTTGEVKNYHPTVKSIELMRWLVSLVAPPQGVILDPFAGSGTTLLACVYEGLSCIGIEQDEEYCTIIRARVAHHQALNGLTQDELQEQEEEEGSIKAQGPIQVRLL